MFKVPNLSLALATLSPPESPKFRFRFNVVPLLYVFLAIYPEKSAEVKKPPVIQIYYGLILVLGIIKHFWIKNIAFIVC
jgi:hypothetical protein